MNLFAINIVISVVLIGFKQKCDPLKQFLLVGLVTHIFSLHVFLPISMFLFTPHLLISYPITLVHFLFGLSLPDFPLLYLTIFLTTLSWFLFSTWPNHLILSDFPGYIQFFKINATENYNILKCHITRSEH